MHTFVLTSLRYVTGDAQPPHNIMSWFQCKGQGKTRDEAFEDIPHDIYAIGTQVSSSVLLLFGTQV